MAEPESVLLPGHDVPLGRYTTVRRLLPPHPHTGLQTVTWLVEGEILHRDSLGNLQAFSGGETSRDAEILAESFAGVGAVVMGKGMFRCGEAP